jgi:hypothetical protein
MDVKINNDATLKVFAVIRKIQDTTGLNYFQQGGTHHAN